jgi:hypothetical protein
VLVSRKALLTLPKAMLTMLTLRKAVLALPEAMLHCRQAVLALPNPLLPWPEAMLGCDKALKSALTSSSRTLASGDTFRSKDGTGAGR